MKKVGEIQLQICGKTKTKTVCVYWSGKFRKYYLSSQSENIELTPREFNAVITFLETFNLGKFESFESSSSSSRGQELDKLKEELITKFGKEKICPICFEKYLTIYFDGKRWLVQHTNKKECDITQFAEKFKKLDIEWFYSMEVYGNIVFILLETERTQGRKKVYNLLENQIIKFEKMDPHKLEELCKKTKEVLLEINDYAQGYAIYSFKLYAMLEELIKKLREKGVWLTAGDLVMAAVLLNLQKFSMPKNPTDYELVKDLPKAKQKLLSILSFTP